MQSEWKSRAQAVNGDEVAELMSMALDNLLDAADDERLALALVADPARAQEWQVWQKLSSQLQSAPAVEPPAGFVAEFERRLARAEQRRRRWAGVGIGALVTLLWFAVVASTAGLGVYVLLWQATWLGETLHALTYWLAVIQNWGQAISATVAAMLSTPQALAIACGYLMAAMVILYAWVQFLRRSVRGAKVTAA